MCVGCKESVFGIAEGGNSFLLTSGGEEEGERRVSTYIQLTHSLTVSPHLLLLPYTHT